MLHRIVTENIDNFELNSIYEIDSYDKNQRYGTLVKVVKCICGGTVNVAILPKRREDEIMSAFVRYDSTHNSRSLRELATLLNDLATYLDMNNDD